mmetsp:Transcript_86539/g.169311  ORF Transcript_86539/g.169311 Transcript_86539/m.169311 type:complete len:193 (+) Transcript_86539:1-579(+)
MQMSQSRQKGGTVSNATALMARMKKGDAVLDDATGWNYCSVYHAPRCQPHLKAGYFNNFFIRNLLGTDEGAPIPWDEVGEDHFAKAKGVLENFDMVVPADALGQSLPVLQCAAGKAFDLGLDGTRGGVFKWPDSPKDKSKPAAALCDAGDPMQIAFCKEFMLHNTWDQKLFEWVSETWRKNKGWGRCKGKAL